MLDKRSGLANLWDEAKAAALSEPERLVYRSRLLGSDKRITNFGGGNTSSKIARNCDWVTGFSSCARYAFSASFIIV